MTTNYRSTFITVAPDSAAAAAEVPPVRGGPTVASLQYELLVRRPYELTSDDVLFAVHAARLGIAEKDRAEEWARFFSRDQACLRSSPLPRRYGWGVHHDEDARVALVPLGSRDYDALVARPDVTVRPAMRTRRAR